MNWQALLQVVLGVFEKNPDLAGQLVSSLLNLFVSNPAILNKAVTVGIAHAEASLPKTPVA
jgi:hypothetical protein